MTKDDQNKAILALSTLIRSELDRIIGEQTSFVVSVGYGENHITGFANFCCPAHAAKLLADHIAMMYDPEADFIESKLPPRHTGKPS